MRTLRQYEYIGFGSDEPYRYRVRWGCPASSLPPWLDSSHTDCCSPAVTRDCPPRLKLPNLHRRILRPRALRRRRRPVAIHLLLRSSCRSAMPDRCEREPSICTFVLCATSRSHVPRANSLVADSSSFATCSSDRCRPTSKSRRSTTRRRTPRRSCRACSQRRSGRSSSPPSAASPLSTSSAARRWLRCARPYRRIAWPLRAAHGFLAPR